MATPGQVHKIYKLSTLGYDQLTKELDIVNKKFELIKKSKLAAEGKLIASKDIADVQKYSDEVAQLVIEEQRLRVEQQKLVNEAKALNLQRQEQIRQSKEAKKNVESEAGSIINLRNRIKELNAEIIKRNQKGGSRFGDITFEGETLSIDQAIAKLKQLTAAEQDFRRQFAKDLTLVGEYTTGIVQAFKRMGLDELVGGQITRTKEKLNSLNTDFDRLQKELLETRAAGQSTETIEKQMIDNRNEVIKLDTELARLKSDLRGTGDIGNQITTSIGNGFKSLKGQVGAFALQFIGIQAIFSKIQQGFTDAKISSDATTDLQIQLGETADEADRLNESLKNIKTRTTLLGLQEIANVALKAGVAKENIAGVTEAIDQVKVAFGKDFGSVEEGTETFAKLINIFFTDGQITGERILKIGNSIRALANETVASVPFLTDFSGRMAGVKQISNVTLPDILGLGAGFEQFKQSAEVSSTTLVKLIPKLATDVEKFAKIAGLANDEFKKLLTETPIEALLKVSEGLVAGKGDVEEFAKTLADAGLDAGRVTTIIATLGGKADVFRERIKRAGETIEDTGAITAAFEKKNTNLAASLDKLNKVFSDFFASKTFQTTLAAIAGLLTIIIGNLPLIITLVGLLTVAWVAQNVTLISLRAQLILYNLGMAANLVLLGALRIAQLAYNVALFAFNGVLAIVTAGLRLFGIAATTASGPLGIILTAVALLGSALLGLSKALGNTGDVLDKNIQRLRLMADLQREAAAATVDQRLKAEQLVKVIQDLSISEKTRLKLLQDLIDIDPIFQKALVDGKINYEKLTDALKEFNKNLLESATLQAAQTRAQAENQKLQSLINLRTTLEERKAGLRTKSFSDLSEEEIQFLPNTAGSTRSIRGTASLLGINISKKEIDTAVANINRAIDAQEKLAEVSKETATTLLANSLKTVPGEGDKPGAKPLTIFEKFKQLLTQGGKEDDFKNLKKEIEKRKGELNVFSKEFQKLRSIEDQIDNILKPKETRTNNRGSQLTGVQKDAFKDIDALRDKQLADLKIRFQQQQVAEENYLLTVLRINRDAINEKLKIIKGANAEERKQIAELNLEKITQEQETNNKIFDLRTKALKKQLDEDIALIKLESAKTENDPTASAAARAQAKLDSDNQILALQEKFNKDVDHLEKDLAQNTLTNTKESADEIRKTKEQILSDQRQLATARLTDIADAGDKQRSEIIANYEKLRQAILENDKLTASQRQKALEKLAKIHNKTIISSELAQLNIEFEQIKKQYEKGLATEKEFLEKKKQLEEKKSEFDQANIDLSSVGIVLPSEAETQKLVSERLSKLFGFKEGSGEEQLLGQVISESFTLAQDAMNAYFDAEENRIRENLSLQLERIDVEKEQVLARAQSQEEIATIEKEFAAKKRRAEQEAGEQLKKQKRAEAKIALATELANIAASSAAFGPGAPILFGILAALALARYALRVSEINSQKFAFGGKPGEVPVRGGKFGGQPHSSGGTDFSFKGKQYNAEANELAVIRTKNAPANKKFTVEGTQMEIASAINKIGGGIDFKPGAKIRKFASGGIIGGVLQPPVSNPSSSTVVVSGGITKEDLDDLKDALIERTEATDRRIDRLEVRQVTSTVTNAQKKEVKQSAIGTL